MKVKYCYCLHPVVLEPVLGQLLVLGAGTAVVGVGVDGDAAAGGEDTCDLDVFGGHEAYEVFHDDVDAVLMEVAVVAEAEEVELQALALHHQRARDVVDDDVSKVGLACLGAQGGELGTIQSHEVLVLGMFVLKRLQHLGGIVVAVVRVLVAQQRDAFQFLFVSRHNLNFAAKI